MALGLISLFLLPIQRLVGLHFNLERESKRVKTMSEYGVKELFLEGYEKNLMDPNVKIGKVKGIGVEKGSDEKNIIILRIVDKKKYIRIIIPQFKRNI